MTNSVDTIHLVVGYPVQELFKNRHDYDTIRRAVKTYDLVLNHTEQVVGVCIHSGEVIDIKGLKKEHRKQIEEAKKTMMLIFSNMDSKPTLFCVLGKLV